MIISMSVRRSRKGMTTLLDVLARLMHVPGARMVRVTRSQLVSAASAALQSLGFISECSLEYISLSGYSRSIIRRDECIIAIAIRL